MRLLERLVHVLIVAVGTTCLLQAAALSNSRHAHFLATVFGSDHLTQLGLSVVDLNSMIQVDQEERHVRAADKQTRLVCAGLDAKDDIVEALDQLLERDEFDPAYSSRSKNLACWVVRVNQKQADDLAKHPFIQTVSVVPSELKLHPSILKLFEVPKSAEGSDQESGVLKVEFGLGTGRGLHGIDIWEAVTSWLQRNKHPQRTAYGHWKQLQSTHARDAVRKHCDYSQLQLTTTTFTAHIRGFDSMLTSNHGLGCLHTLIDHAIADPRVVRVIWTPEMRVHNDNARGIVQSGKPRDEPYTDAGLTGSGEVVGVADTGLDDLSCFFIDGSGTPTPRSDILAPKTFPERRKVIQYVAFADSSDIEEGHGTHVCGSVAGKDGDNKFNGMAQDAKLAFFDIGFRDDPALQIPSLSSFVFPIAASAGARVHSNSWGSTFRFCDEFCLDIDNYTYFHDDFLAVFSAGNEGEFGYFSITNPAMAKNCIAVGASEEKDAINPTFRDDDMAFFSSMGPTFDNRIKPDVVAPGYFIDSAAAAGIGEQETCEVTPKAGTSMAAPQVAGAAAMVRQYFRDEQFWADTCNQHYPSCGAFNCSGYLVKAVLIHSGTGMKRYDAGNVAPTILPTQELGEPPDYFQGFGRVLLANVLPLPDDPAFDLFVHDRLSLTSDQTVKFEVQIQDDSQPLRVTISWYDPPTIAFTSKQVLHDLDLLVISPNGTRYWGNRVENGDERNNNERVVIENPEEGNYTVLVHAFPLIAADSQEIAVVITSGGRVEGPEDGAGEFPTVSRECTDTEILVNLIDLGEDAWDIGIYMYITNEDDEIVFLGVTVEAFNSTSACLPEGCYTAFLQLEDPSFQSSEDKSNKDRKIDLKASLSQRAAGTNVKKKAQSDGARKEKKKSEKKSKKASAPGDTTYYSYSYDDNPFYYYYYATDQVDEVVAEISSCAFLLYSDETSFDFCVRDDQCDYCDGATQLTVRWDDVPDLRFQALWIVYSFPNPPGGDVGPELYGASALDGRRRTICLDDGTYIVHVPTAPFNGSAVVEACDLQLFDGDFACIEVLDGQCSSFTTNCPRAIGCPIPSEELEVPTESDAATPAVAAKEEEKEGAETTVESSDNSLGNQESRQLGLCSDSEPSVPTDEAAALRAAPATFRFDVLAFALLNLALAYAL